MSEPLNQHDRDSRELRELCAQRDAARATVRQQAERIAELEAEVLEQARCNGMGAERELALMAERDRLRAEVERLRADGERLDWVEACPATQLPKDAEVMRRWLWHRPAGAGNLRAAIDAARTTHKDTE